MMPVGSKWELYVPADLAYGDEGYGEDIAPGSTLVFDVELLSIKKNAANTPPAPDQQPESGPKEAGRLEIRLLAQLDRRRTRRQPVLRSESAGDIKAGNWLLLPVLNM